MYILGNFTLSLILIFFIGHLTSLLLFKKISWLFRLILDFALGFGIISFLLIVLGILYNFRLSTFFVVYTALIVFLLFKNKKNLSISRFRFFTFSNKILVIILSLLILPSLLYIFLFPEMVADYLIYGQWTRILYKTKQISFIEGGPTLLLGFASNYPSAFYLLEAFIYMFTGENIFFLRILSLFISSLLILLVYLWSKEIFEDKNLSLYAVLIFISFPVIIVYSRSAMHYIYLILQFSLACYFLQRFFLKKNKKYLYLSSTFGGFSALTSYLGLLYLPLFSLSLLVGKNNYKRIMLSFILFLLIISPWYLRNLIVLGNPVWPFGGGKYIDPFIQANTFNVINENSKEAGFNYENLENLKKSLTRLFFSINYGSNGLNPFFTFLAIPAVLFWIKTKDEKMLFFISWFLILLTFNCVAFPYSYLMLISIPTTFLSTFLIKSLQRFKGIKWVLTPLLLTLYFSLFFVSSFWDCPTGEGKIPEIIKSLGNHQKILDICYRTPKIWYWVDKNLPYDTTIATNDWKLYLYNRTVLSLRGWALRGLYYSTNINTSIKILKENNVSYIVIVRLGAQKELPKEFDKFPEYFYLIKQFDNDGKIYKLI